jgi:hypothetical protein
MKVITPWLSDTINLSKSCDRVRLPAPGAVLELLLLFAGHLLPERLVVLELGTPLTFAELVQD